jgi:hypothetical protein
VFTASGAELVVFVSRSKNRMDEERLVKLWYTRVVPSMAPVTALLRPPFTLNRVPPVGLA